MLSACICVQNTCSLEAHCYMDRTFLNAVTTECTEKEIYRKKIKPSAFIHKICATFCQRFTCVLSTEHNVGPVGFPIHYLLSEI